MTIQGTPLRKRSRDSSDSDYTGTTTTTVSSSSADSPDEDFPSSLPTKKTRRDKYTTPSSIHVLQMTYTSKEQLSVNIIFADKREGNQRVFGTKEKRAPYEYALETALNHNDAFNKAARECKEIFVENKIHRNEDGHLYFSGHMRKFDHHMENRIKCYTFHLFVTEPTRRKDFHYHDANVVESADYITIMVYEDMLNEQRKEIQMLRDEIEHWRDKVFSNQ